MYFWSFMVALLLFSGGGMFSVYEGIHKIRHPEHIERVWLGALILFGSLLLEGWATFSNLRELNERRGKQSFFRHLVDTKDSSLVVVFGENSAAVLGLGFALLALGAAHFTGDPMWDGLGSLAVGLVLVGVAVFLARKVQSLLLGESASPEIRRSRAILPTMRPERVSSALRRSSGPGEVIVAIKILFERRHVLSCWAHKRVRGGTGTRRPEVRWAFVSPTSPKIRRSPEASAFFRAGGSSRLASW
jgi:divalent metal cation (Fe/Co/Zn/Cd) transporter